MIFGCYGLRSPVYFNVRPLKHYVIVLTGEKGLRENLEMTMSSSNLHGNSLRTGEPVRILWMVKAAARNIGLDPKTVWTHTLRKSFRKVLNATPELDEDTREAIMGHTLLGSRGNYFDLHDIDQIAGKYMKADFSPETDSTFFGGG